MQIDIDFEVYKVLTARRASESVTYNDVLRDLLKLGSGATPATVSRSDSGAGSGIMAAGRYLPDGTQLSVIFKGRTHTANVSEGRIISAGGKTFSSLSGAAHSITGNNVNGLRFWRAKRPDDTAWTVVAQLPILEERS